jgi:hypothetical protein
MGLHINFELSLPAATSESYVSALMADLHDRARALPFAGVSNMVRLTERELAGPWPLHGLAYDRLDDVAHVYASLTRDELYGRAHGLSEPNPLRRIDVPADVPTIAIGFGLSVGRGSEPAAFGLTKLGGAEHESLAWRWQCSCKTQYASVLGNEHLLRCHTSVVALLDAAVALGVEVEVHDETGYWETRDTTVLFDRVAEMNRIVAKLAGALTDSVRDAGADSRQLDGAIFKHPDFERLETD